MDAVGRLFAAMGIVAAQPLEISGVCLQGVAVVVWIVYLEQGVFDISIQCNGTCGGRWHNFRHCAKGKMACQCFERHACGCGLSVGRVAGNVGCAKITAVEQREVYVGLMFPYIDNALCDVLFVERLK